MKPKRVLRGPGFVSHAAGMRVDRVVHERGARLRAQSRVLLACCALSLLAIQACSERHGLPLRPTTVRHLDAGVDAGASHDAGRRDSGAASDAGG